MSTKYTPAQWLLIDCAAMYGLDKKHFSERLEFGREVLELIKCIDPTDIKALKGVLKSYIDKADEPEMFAASCLAIADVLAGRPVHYMVGLDAASSGPQILSCLTRCVTGMRNTGAIFNGLVPDLYTTIKDLLGFNAPRKQVKKATVPYVYGSKRAPETVFGDKYQAFVKAYAKAVPLAEWAKNTLINCWQDTATFHEWLLPDGAIAHVNVIVEDDTKYTFQGKQYTYKYKEIGCKDFGDEGTRSVGANVTHSYDAYILRELHRRCNYDASRIKKCISLLERHMAGTLDSRFAPIDNTKLELLESVQSAALRFNNYSIVSVEYIDAGTVQFLSHAYCERLVATLKEVLTNPSFKVRTIHDEFASNPMFTNEMKYCYNWLLAEAYASTWLYDVIQDIGGRSYHDMQPEFDQEVYQQILENEYALN